MPKSNSWWEQAVQNRLVAAVLAMVVLMPLVALPAETRQPGAAALVFESFAILLMATLLWRAQWNLDKERVIAFLKTGVNLPTVALLGLAIVSCIRSPHKAYSAQETLRLGAGVLLYLVISYQFRRSEYLAKLIDVIVFVSLVSSLLGFAQFATNSEVYATGMFGDHQLFGSFLMLLLPLVAITAITETKTNRQLAAQVATILTAACLLLTHTRSAWVGGAAGLVTLGLLAAYSLSRQNRIGSRKHVWVMPVMLLFVAGGFFLAVSPDTGSIVDRASTLAQVDKESGWDYRQIKARGSLEMARARPLTGWGIGLYPYYQREFTGSGTTLSGGLVKPFLNEEAHNLYLQTAAELGIPGLALLVSIVAMFLGLGMARLRAMETGIRRNLLLGSMASLVAFAVDAAGSPAWQLGQNSMFLWLVLGIGVSCARPKLKSSEDEASRFVPQLVSRPMIALASAGLLAALVSTLAVASVGNYKQLVNIVISPRAATLRGGYQNQTFTVIATFRNNQRPGDGSVTQDVTAQTVFTQTGGIGDMTTPSGGAGTPTGTGANTYTTVFRERDTPFVNAVYTESNSFRANQSARDVSQLRVAP